MRNFVRNQTTMKMIVEKNNDEDDSLESYANNRNIKDD